MPAIKWNKRAIAQLDEAISYIETSAPVNADKVKQEIPLRIDALTEHPE